MSTSYTVELVAYVCPECGLLYGHAKEYKYGECPSCLGKRIKSLKTDVYDLENDLCKARNSISALKGVITKLKNKLIEPLFKEEAK
jgi:DNA-directed RNA polymerase subunit RPC12/RpoP